MAVVWESGISHMGWDLVCSAVDHIPIYTASVSAALVLLYCRLCVDDVSVMRRSVGSTHMRTALYEGIYG